MIAIPKAALAVTMLAATLGQVAVAAPDEQPPSTPGLEAGGVSSTKPSPDRSDSDADLADAYREVAVARANIMNDFKKACGNRNAYLQIYEMSSDRDRALLKETCARRQGTPRRKR